MEVCSWMSPVESPPRRGLHALADSVSKLLSRAGEEILGALEKRCAGFKSSGISGDLFQPLRRLFSERMAVTAQCIVELLEQEVVEYRRQLERQSRLLEVVLSPVVRLNRTDFVSSTVPKMTPANENPALLSQPTGPSSSACSDMSAAESDDNWRDSDISSSKKEKEKTDQVDQAALSDRPVNQICVICGKTFRHKNNLVKHAESHSDSPEHLCGVCGLCLESSNALSDHLKSHREKVGTGGTCKVCRKTFQNMETHMRSHTGVKPFTCDICSKSFPRPGALRRHKKIHSRRKPDTCQVCGLNFTDDELLQDHLKTHEGGDGDQNEDDDVREECELEKMKPKRNTEPAPGGTSVSLCCKVCGDAFHSGGFLRKHAETHCKDSKSICGVCGKQLDSPNSLQTHLQTHRETSGTCSICGKSFQNMVAHMRSHTGIKPYRCTICSKRFPRPGALRRHKKIHSGERPYVCQLCGKTFIESTALKTHSRSHSWEVHKGKEFESTEDCKTVSPEGQNAKMLTGSRSCCKVCGESFQSNGSLRKHAKSHSAESVCGVCGERLLPSQTLTNHLQVHREEGKICHICGKTYQNIETHMRGHTGVKPYRCSICGKSFPRPGALRRHKRIHSGERPYICEFCGKTFIDNGALTTHIRNHTGDKPANRVPCETCGKSLASVHVLEVHKRIHTGEKPFLCRMCGKAFRQVGGLNAHMLTHTGEKPFSCSLCNKSFSTKGYLETHIRFHKKERAFSCHLCWKAFVTKNDLKKHLLTHTGEKPYSCRVCGKSYQEKRSRDIHMKIHLVVDSCKEPITGQDNVQPNFTQL
ncbi:oocyte zinc finger protein XlCOF6-like [Melanotaenia boesemani]|uniref:oocyte zinc finger protein XlCOF6-like n=1 Tax=Melanotaenia boesemani TaxID=1250792 RepID=UPI001C050FF5|nr:oocyte zinc finger protein XlCOF6-like [Melanotaenia boesemani]